MTPDRGLAASPLPVGEAARRLRTTPATLRAWDRRYGLAPSAHTSGGHRRYSEQDMVRLERVRELLGRGVAPADAARAVLGSALAPQPTAAGTPVAQTVGELTAAMHRLDVRTVTGLVTAALDSHDVATTWRGLLAPALVGIGEHWAATGCGVEVEHMTSGVLEAALRRRTELVLLAGTRPTVLLASCPDERHTLPLVALAAALADEGRLALVLGDLPTRALVDAVRRVRPDTVVLWARSREVADVECLRRALAASGACVHPAGPGWDRGRLPAGADRHLADLADALAALTGAAAPSPGAPG